MAARMNLILVASCRALCSERLGKVPGRCGAGAARGRGLRERTGTLSLTRPRSAARPGAGSAVDLGRMATVPAGIPSQTLSLHSSVSLDNCTPLDF